MIVEALTPVAGLASVVFPVSPSVCSVLLPLHSRLRWRIPTFISSTLLIIDGRFDGKMHGPSPQKSMRRRHVNRLDERDSSLLDLPSGTSSQATEASSVPSSSGTSSADPSPTSASPAPTSSNTPLLNVGIPFSDIPILGPILEPIVSPILGNGPVQSGSSPSDPTTPAPSQPASSPPTSPQPTSPQPTPSQPTSSGGSAPPPSSSGGGGNGSSGGGTGSSNGPSGSSGGSGATGTSAGGPSASNSNPTTGSLGKPSSTGPSSTGTPGNGSSAPNSNAQSDIATYEPVQNVNGGAPSLSTPGSTPNSTSGSSSSVSSGTDLSIPAAGATGPSASGPGIYSSSVPSASGGGDEPIAASSHGLSGGIIAAIIIICSAILLTILVCCFRRCAIARRKSNRNWWAGGASDPRGSTPVSSTQYFRDHPAASGTASARSSFGTMFDHGDMFEVPPPVPPTASMPPAAHLQLQLPVRDIWPSNLSGSISAPPLVATVDSEPSPVLRSPDRTKIHQSSGSGSSGGSSNHSTAQYLLAPDSATGTVHKIDGGLSSPMSVRPFSPSESWSFPKPPPKEEQNDGHTFGGPPSQDHASTEYDTASENPFSDFVGQQPPTPLSFATVDTETASHFATVETIRRPFVPTMADEMPAAPGEQVRMLQRFSDGWAYAEKITTGNRGLIPIDCLRTAEEDLPAFLAAKRLSSYRSPK